MYSKLGLSFRPQSAKELLTQVQRPDGCFYAVYPPVCVKSNKHYFLARYTWACWTDAHLGVIWKRQPVKFDSTCIE